MAGLFQTLFGTPNDGTHPKDVAKAYYDLNRQLAIDEGTDEQQQWKKLFDQGKLAGKSPAQMMNPKAGDANMQPDPMSELERWKRQVDGLVQSGNPVLQKEGLSMLAQYRQQANSSTNDTRTSGQKEYAQAVQQGFKGTLQDWLALNPRGTTVNVGDKAIKGTDFIIDGSTGKKINVPLGSTAADVLATYPNAVYAEQPTAAESKQTSAITTAENDLTRLKTLLTEGGADLSGFNGLIKQWRGGDSISGSIINQAVDMAGKPLSSSDVEALSLALSLSNTILEASRGAQVGPAEQIMFNKQLPVPGQPKAMIQANIDRAQRNISLMKKLTAEGRGFYGSPEQAEMMNTADPEAKAAADAWSKTPEGRAAIIKYERENGTGNQVPPGKPLPYKADRLKIDNSGPVPGQKWE